jgi:hypothetical protein
MLLEFGGWGGGGGAHPHNSSVFSVLWELVRIHLAKSYFVDKTRAC